MEQDDIYGHPLQELPLLIGVADVLRDLPELLATERERRGLSYITLANELEVSSTAVYFWIQRKHAMSIDNAEKVLRWLHESLKEK